MQQFQNILVSTDTRSDDYRIVEQAAEIAGHGGAALKLVDVMPDFPWTVRLTLKDYEHVRDLMEREKQEKLESLATPIRDQGIRVETKVLRGKSSVETIREVLRNKHDLVLRVAKGKDSRRKGFFGTTGVRLLRECPCAVWLVSPSTTERYKHVLSCIDTSNANETDAELNEKVFGAGSLISQYYGAMFSVLHAWTIHDEAMLDGRMNLKLYEEMKKDYSDWVESLLDKFLQSHGSSLHEENVHLIKGDVPTVVSDFVDETAVDLVVMGTVARAGAAGMIIGNTAERILDRIECSVLALKPDEFVSPITLSDYINPAGARSQA